MHGQRVATSFPHLVEKHLADHGIQLAKLIRLDGAVRSLVESADVQSIMDRLEEIGCKAILVTPLRASPGLTPARVTTAR